MAQAVFKFAVRKTEEIALRLLARNGIDASEIDLFVSHQANRRIITAAAERLGLPESKVVINLEMYGNTTAATIPLALADAVKRQAAEARRPRAPLFGRRRLHRRGSPSQVGILRNSELRTQNVRIPETRTRTTRTRTWNVEFLEPASAATRTWGAATRTSGIFLMPAVFLLSPANCGGNRARIVMSERATFDLAARLRGPGARRSAKCSPS